VKLFLPLDLFEIAKGARAELEHGEQFIVKDFFRGFD